MIFLSKEYLPRSEERVAYLRKIIRGRPVAVLAAGPSIRTLEQRIGELSQKDICYFGVNKFFVPETHILQKINRRMSVITCSGREGMPYIISSVVEFLERNEDNMFFSSFWRDAFGLVKGDFDLDQFLKEHDRKLLFFSLDAHKNVPNPQRPLHFIESNSLLLLVQLALIGQAESITLFGADGHGGENTKDYYYRQDEYAVKGWSRVNESLANDAVHFFNPIAARAIANTCKTYGVPLVNILNCSEKSFYTPFPRVSYDVAFDHLLRGRKVFPGLDLRVPVKPRAFNTVSSFAEKISSLWERHGWNSFGVLAGKVRQRLTKNFA